jgi:calcium permeable stress-gated cation channel
VMLFAAIGLFFFYFAYRYNFLYVYDTGVDTRGAVYARALQHLFVGLYVAEMCLVGLFATALPKGKGAIGPFVLMIVLLIFTALYHVSLNAALGPLTKYLPKTLDVEERRSLLEGEADHEDIKDAQDPTLPHEKGDDRIDHPAPVDPTSAAPHKKPNFLTKFLHPGVYNDYQTMRRLVPQLINPTEDIEDEVLINDAYLPPAVWTDLPQLVVPRDDGGVSAQEVRDSSKVVSITNQGAYLNEKNKIIVDDDFMSTIYFEDKAYRMKTEH